MAEAARDPFETLGDANRRTIRWALEVSMEEEEAQTQSAEE